MPAKVKADQALHLAEALAKGTRDATGIMQNIVGEQIRDLV
jgi:hypothetical protein